VAAAASSPVAELRDVRQRLQHRKSRLFHALLMQCDDARHTAKHRAVQLQTGGEGRAGQDQVQQLTSVHDESLFMKKAWLILM
jgi:hypothetical protein